MVDISVLEDILPGVSVGELIEELRRLKKINLRRARFFKYLLKEGPLPRLQEPYKSEDE